MGQSNIGKRVIVLNPTYTRSTNINNVCDLLDASLTPVFWIMPLDQWIAQNLYKVFCILESDSEVKNA